MSPDTINEEQFRADAVAFLEANAKSKQEETVAWGEGSDKVGLLAEKTFEEEMEEVREGKAWKAQVFDAGFGWITGPSQYGGRELPSSYERVWQAEVAQFDTPSEQPFGIGLGMVAPTILAHATDKVKDAYLRKMYRGDIVGCQLFSEPAAGSDLAGLQGRAVRDGDEWVLNGQKIWMTFGTRADWFYVLCRTNADAPKHQGLSLILVPAHQRGVDVRPIRNLAGGEEFAEVFFSDARTRADLVVGPVDGAWSVVMGTVGTERGTTALPYQAAFEQQLHDLVGELRERGRTDDPVVRQRLAQAWIGLQLNRHNNARMLTRLVRDGTLGPEASLSKLFWSHWHRDVGALMMDLLGADATVVGDGWSLDPFQTVFLNSRAETIYGSANEIQRNIVAERLLGLPKEPRV